MEIHVWRSLFAFIDSNYLNYGYQQTIYKYRYLESVIYISYFSFMAITCEGSLLAVKAKIYGALYKQSSSIAFDETSSYWSALKSSQFLGFSLVTTQ